MKESLISDYPRFPHRGILLDSSRHFMFKEVIFDMMVRTVILKILRLAFRFKNKNKKPRFISLRLYTCIVYEFFFLFNAVIFIDILPRSDRVVLAFNCTRYLIPLYVFVLNYFVVLFTSTRLLVTWCNRIRYMPLNSLWLHDVELMTCKNVGHVIHLFLVCGIRARDLNLECKTIISRVKNVGNMSWRKSAMSIRARDLYFECSSIIIRSKIIKK